MRKRIDIKLLVIVLSTIFTGLVLFSVFTGVYYEKAENENIEHRSERLISLLAIALRNPVWQLNQKSLDQIRKAVILDDSVVALVVKEGEGKQAETVINVIRGEGKGKTIEELKLNPRLKFFQENITNINDESEILGSVTILMSLKSVGERVKIASYLISAGAVFVLIALFITLYFSVKMVVGRAIHALQRSANELASGNLEYPIAVKREDELGVPKIKGDRRNLKLRFILWGNYGL